MKDFEIPSNIKQIGGVDENLKIYVEDYAISYLKRYAQAAKDKDRIAFLVGKNMLIDGQKYLFVCGAIQGKYTEYVEGAETFSDESFGYAYEQLEKYFDGYEIVGWMQSQPGYGVGLNPVCADYHMNNFIKPYHVLLIGDPIEKLDCFYSWDNSMKGICEVKGYFIFYDRNRGMQEYMLENRISSIKPFSKAKDRKSDAEDQNKSSEDKSAQKPKRFKSLTKELRKPSKTHNKDSSKDTVEKNESPEYRRVINMLASLSAVLFIICFIMGAGLIQNDGRIGELEKDLNALNSTYSYMLNQLSELATQTVYAYGDREGQASQEHQQASDDEEILSNDNEHTQTATETPNVNSIEQSQHEETPSPTPNNSEGATSHQNTEPIALTTPTVAPTIAPTSAPTPTITPTPQATSIVLPRATLFPSHTPVQTENVRPTPSQEPPVNNNSTPSNEESNNSSEINNQTGGNIEYDTYVVKRGDTLSQICYEYYGTMDMLQAVMDFNNIVDSNTIYFGKVLKMPKY